MKITIGLPFYNNENTLADAIRSVFAQSVQDWELLLVNDGSTDRSLEIAQSIDDPRVRVTHDSVNTGLPTRLNQIAELAQGEYLARMDADDLMHPDRLEQQIAHLEQSPEIDVVGTAMFSINEKYQIQGIRGNHPLRITPRRTLAHGIMVHASVLARREWFLRHPYNQKLRRSQDRDLWCQSCFDSTFAVVPTPLMYILETAGERMIGNYLRGCRSDRALFRKYGPSFVGHTAMRKLILKSYLKSSIYQLAHWAGLYQKLVSRRNVPLNSAELDAASIALSAIRNTAVPGLEPPQADATATKQSTACAA